MMNEKTKNEKAMNEFCHSFNHLTAGYDYFRESKHILLFTKRYYKALISVGLVSTRLHL